MPLVTQSVEAVIRRSACFVLGTETGVEATGTRVRCHGRMRCSGTWSHVKPVGRTLRGVV